MYVFGALLCRALHLSVALLYAAHLQRDLAALHAGKRSSSLAAKWAPTPKGKPCSATQADASPSQ
jgi:hypothetical protein